MAFSGATVWKFGLVPQSVANGLTNILVLFYLIQVIHGNLLDVGLVTGVSALALIPSQAVWGRLVDSTGRCKPFLVFGFLGFGASMAAIPMAANVAELLVVVSLKSVFYAATLPARQLLTVESEHRDGWQKGLANMSFLTASGETIGMGLGTAVVVSLGFNELFLMCGLLCFASAAALSALAQEPGLMIQRRLVSLERSLGTIMAVSEYAGYPRLSQAAAPRGDIMSTLNRSTKFLLVGILCFSLAGSAYYSPLPAYFLEFYSSQQVFFVFFAGSLAGALGYLLVGRVLKDAVANLLLSSLSRVIVLPMLLLAAIGESPGLAAAAVVLAVLEVLWSLFDISSTFAYLETAKIGRAGFYGALVGLGSAGGGFLGGYFSMEYGFSALFTVCSLLCAAAFVAYMVQYRGMAGFMRQR
jgi:predicted MFS family arabinose efflux permease